MTAFAIQVDKAPRPDQSKARAPSTEPLSYRRIMIERLAGVRAQELARERVEATYFDGRPVLFPATRKHWAEEREAAALMTGLASQLAVLDGLIDEPPPSEATPDEAAVTRFLADLVEPARVETLEKLGEGERALIVATRWLRPRFDDQPLAAEGTDNSAP